MSVEDESRPTERAGPSRRTLLKGAAVGAGILWAAPAIATFTAGPAAASPAGCPDCGQLVLPTADGNGTSLSNWTGVSGIAAPAGVFRATTSSTGTATFTRNFSDACTARFGTLPAVGYTFALGTLTSGFGGAGSTVTFRFWAGLGGTGSILSTDTATVAGSVGFTIPTGARSFTVVMSLGRANPGGNQGGTADNIAVTLGSC